MVKTEEERRQSGRDACRRWYKKNKGYWSQWREDNKDKTKVSDKKWGDKNKGKVKVKNKIYKEKHKERINKWRTNGKLNPIGCMKIKVRNEAHRGFKQLIIEKRGRNCEKCGVSPKSIILHHEEYRNEEDCVLLVCKPCHNILHENRK